MIFEGHQILRVCKSFHTLRIAQGLAPDEPIIPQRLRKTLSLAANVLSHSSENLRRHFIVKRIALIGMAALIVIIGPLARRADTPIVTQALTGKRSTVTAEAKHEATWPLTEADGLAVLGLALVCAGNLLGRRRRSQTGLRTMPSRQTPLASHSSNGSTANLPIGNRLDSTRVTVVPPAQVAQ